jgi:Zn-dependent peptidase ImmA (M78 family)/transcriptional regulator with XRE-family HTH domain
MLQRVLNSASIDPHVCAELLGLNPQLFAQWASGQSNIPESVLPLLSAVLGVPQSALAVSPRAAKNLSDSDVTPQIWYKFRGPELVDADREYVVLIRQVGHYLNELEEVTRQKSVQWKNTFDTIRNTVDIQAPPREQGKTAAALFRQATSLGHGATGSGEILRSLLRAMGVLVFETPLAQSRIEGCSFYVGSNTAPRPCAFANTHHTTWFRRNVILMHEVGHAIFEPFTGATLDFVGAQENDTQELRAQAFAQETLVPKEVLFHVAQSNGIKWSALNEVGIARLVADTHVEQRMVISAAIDAGFIGVERRDELSRVDISSHLRSFSDHALTTDEFLEKTGQESFDWMGKRTSTLTPRPIRLPIGYVNAVVDACHNRQISPAKAAEYLLIDEQEFVSRFGDIYEDVEV